MARFACRRGLLFASPLPSKPRPTSAPKTAHAAHKGFGYQRQWRAFHNRAATFHRQTHTTLTLIDSNKKTRMP